MTLTLIDYLSLLAIVIIGIPHGALDLNLAIAGNSSSTRRRGIIFVSYITIAIASFIAWYLMPSIALGIFLILSTVHFGRANPLLLDYKNQNKFDALIGSIVFQGGLTTIFLPWLYWNDIKDIFAALGAYIEAFQIIGSFAVLAWLLSALVTSLHYRSFRFYGTLMSLVGLVYFKEVFTPLCLFSIFFCILHSIPHYLKASNELGTSPKKPPIGFLINTISAWAIVATVSIFFYQSQSLNSATLNGIFSILFALTVPHMILVDLLLPRNLRAWRIT
jgi:Brp/Blh family beta-carotene 15,15'-monooxygenase